MLTKSKCFENQKCDQTCSLLFLFNETNSLRVVLLFDMSKQEVFLFFTSFEPVLSLSPSTFSLFNHCQNNFKKRSKKNKKCL